MRVFLPTGADKAVGEGSAAEKGRPEDANQQEVRFICYAWPIEVGKTGNRAFFINQEGDLLQMNNRLAAPYDGAAAGPAFDASLALELLGFGGPEAKEGLASYLEKRKPDFSRKGD